MRKIILSITIITISFLLSGCWDLTESEKLGLVSIIGIDSTDDGQIKVLIQEMSSTEQQSRDQESTQSSKALSKAHQAVGGTISEAIEKIYASNYHKTYLAHTNSIILSERLVSSVGIDPIIDFFERNIEIRRNTWILVAPANQLPKIFDTNINVESDITTGKIIKGIIENKIKSSFLTANTLGDFLNSLWGTGSQPYTAGIEIKKYVVDEENENTNQNEKKSYNYDLSIKNTALFKNKKLVGWMNNNESAGLLWAKGDMKGGILPVYYGGKDISLKIIRASSNIKPVIKDDKMEINLNINAESHIAESQVNLDYNKIDVIKVITDLQNEEIKKQVIAALDKSKELDSDVFGFGSYFYAKYPEYFKEMQDQGDDYYQHIKVNINVNSIINQIGLVKQEEK